MADTISPGKTQSIAEIRVWDIDFSPDLKAGVTVSSAVATHTPPSGAASTPTVGTISANVVPVSLGPLAVTGKHILEVVATLSDGEKSDVRILIDVPF